MKKMLLVICVFLLTATQNVSCADELYSISQLKDASMQTWQETYNAFGRIIEVNEKIIIPDVQTAPVILVQACSAIQGSQYSVLKHLITEAAIHDSVNKYEFSTSDFMSYFCYGWPNLWDESKGYMPDMIGQKTRGLFSFDMSTAYADANQLTIGDAFSIAQEQLSALFPDMTIYLRNVALWDRTHWKKNDESISEKGYYMLECAQVFHGIPLMASIHNAFALAEVGNENTWLDARGLIVAEVMDENSFSLNCEPYEEAELLFDDIPLLPFDAVKKQMEQMILTGYVRFVDSVQLGYVQFDTDDFTKQMLVPCWVVWCQYIKEGAKAEPWHELYEDSIFIHNEYFKPIIFNAQTGEMVDPQSIELDRCQAPGIITW